MKHDWNVFVGQKVDAKKPVLDFRRRQRDQVVVVEEPRRHFQNGVVRPESVNNGLQVDQPLLGLGAVVVAQLTEQLLLSEVQSLTFGIIPTLLRYCTFNRKVEN